MGVSGIIDSAIAAESQTAPTLYSVSSAIGPIIQIEPPTATVRVVQPGTAGQIAFGADNFHGDTADRRLFARLQLDGATVREEGLSLLKVGPSTRLPQNRYATLGYFASGQGTEGEMRASDRRYWFVAGSPTKPQDRPTSGVRIFQVSELSGGAYNANGPFNRIWPVEGSATIALDFATDTLTLTFISAYGGLTDETNGTLRFPVTSTAILERVDDAGTVTYRGGGDRVGLSVFARLYGPNADEIGIGFSARVDSPRGPANAIRAHMALVGYAP
ncbi:hypothetical protein CVN68_04610 [Sphingomonas psychrotolerans]|uniref:Uncharacterized protein n=2 Tax=Sphingomonas psychrotolerans TaxID=1327635 RepID=A0A2K8MBS7_9SPHN|nr:hypothetical protein CVN68_04610 [Sphingomonas psychrotolerans]